jgi:hypothetical protein
MRILLQTRAGQRNFAALRLAAFRSGQSPYVSYGGLIGTFYLLAQNSYFAALSCPACSVLCVLCVLPALPVCPGCSGCPGCPGCLGCLGCPSYPALPVLRIPLEAQLVEESMPELPAATVNHRRGISDVTIRSEREQRSPRRKTCGRQRALETRYWGWRGSPGGTSDGRISGTRKIRALSQETNCSS